MRQEIVVSRDGIWPFIWNWRADVPLPKLGREHHMSGCALTAKRAWAKAERACATVEYDGERSQKLRAAA